MMTSIINNEPITQVLITPKKTSIKSPQHSDVWLGLGQSETRPLGGQCLVEPRQSHSCDRKPWWLWCETTLPMEKIQEPL